MRVPTVVCNIGVEFPVLNAFSDFNKLEKVIAWVLRFIQNCRTKHKNLAKSLSTDELKKSTNTIVRLVQKIEFSRELSHLQNNKSLETNSKLLPLNPFIDDQKIIRVGGRLRNANIANDVKFPIVLPKNHFVTKLIIKREHERQLHAGPQATLAAIRRRFWIIAGRSAVRQVLYHCHKCFKVYPTVLKPKMGDLPSKRVQPGRPFLTAGVDFAGPVLIRETKGRGKRLIKSYIALFVCFATKAVHIELVTDLSTDEFLGAFRRFISRRGNPTDMYSDNGTNFVGAKNQLYDLFTFFKNEQCQTKIHNELANIGIKWHFIPAKSPHMGGLWEINIKSVKSHLKKVVGQAHLTYSEMYTLLVRIEAVLNSRPLTPLTLNPNDLEPLTPSHFLIGETLTAYPEYDVSHISLNRLSRWQLIEKIRVHFWKRWKREYLTSLQSRVKWCKEGPQAVDLKGSMVILVDENAPPLQWRMGRIADIHPGDDGQVRVVSVKTAQGIVKRALQKVCLLPKEETSQK